MGSGEGLCVRLFVYSDPVGGLGACPPEKKSIFGKKFAILSKFWYFFPILQHKNFQHAKIKTVTTFNMKSPVNNKPLDAHETRLAKHYAYNARQLDISVN